jgi:ATP-binding cassette subfamily B protein
MDLVDTKKVTRALPVIIAYAKASVRYPWLLSLVFLSSILIEVMNVVAPKYIQKFIDVLSSGAPAENLTNILFGILLIYTLLSLTAWIGRRIQTLSIMHVEARIMSDLSNSAFVYLLGHSHNFFISNFAGTLTRRVSRYSRAFEQVLDSLVFNFFSTAVYATGVIIVLFQKNYFLGLGLLAWTAVFLTIQVLMARHKQPLRVARAAEDSKVTGLLSDAVSNQSTISLFASSKYERSLFGKAIESWRAATMRSWNADAWIMALQGLLAIAIEVGLLYGAVLLWERGQVTVGDFVLIQVYVLGLIDRLWNIGNSMRKLYDAFADAYEMIEILETPHAVQDKTQAKELVVSEGSIQLKDVLFNFNEDRSILDNFSLDISPREKVALVGPSGAGKSTITKLLLRFYDVTGGSIEIDGQNIAHVTQDSLREAISFVPQEPILFHRSLMDNIRYGNKDTTDEQVFEAAKKAHCHEFISGLSLGYETYVGERGVKLSGGERQRVAIARAILKNAPILILDEATSSLDSESESLIQDALKVLMEGKTVIVIAHRLSTIMTMDRIVVIENGGLAAQGTHAELLDQKGSLYHTLWSIQAGSFLADTDSKGA